MFVIFRRIWGSI